MVNGVTQVKAEANIELIKKMMELQKQLMEQLIEGSLNNISTNVENSIHKGQIVNLLA